MSNNCSSPFQETGSTTGSDDQQRVKLLVNNELLSDISFSVGSEGTLIYGHRFPLAVASDVFYRMFTDNADPPSAGEESIEVPDIEPETFLEMLKFVYYDSPTIDEDNLVELYYAAVKYNLVELKERCLLFIEEEEASVLPVFMDNLERGFEELNIACLKAICSNPLVMFKSSDFLELPLELVEKIANQSKLRCNDDQLLRALKKWSKHQDGEMPQEEAFERLSKIVRRQQEQKRDYQCRKWLFFGSSSYTIESGRGTFNVTALKQLELYGIGMYIGCKEKEIHVAILVTVTSEDKVIRQFQANVPIREDIYVYDCMFEKVSMPPKAKVTIVCDGPKRIGESKPYEKHLEKFAFYDRWLTSTGDSSALELCTSRNNQQTAIAYILFQTKGQ